MKNNLIFEAGKGKSGLHMSGRKPHASFSRYFEPFPEHERRVVLRRDCRGIRMANKTAIMAVAWRTKGALRPAQSLLNPPLIFGYP